VAHIWWSATVNILIDTVKGSTEKELAELKLIRY